MIRRSISFQPEDLAEIEAYAASIDRSLSNFALHAMKQYMRRYPKEAEKRPSRGPVVSVDGRAPDKPVQLHAGSP